ncbi:MAG TPA: hypothetical protein VFE28_09280 [Candidatus Krumholzibacteria bacterium]|nr:hypothetical protein [Candidatus Krumholzibacteria bacterium]
MLSRHSSRDPHRACAPVDAATGLAGDPARSQAQNRAATLRPHPALAVAALVTALVTAAPAAAEKVSLALSPSPGDSLRYRVQVQQELSFQGMTVTATEAGSVHIASQASKHDTLQFLVHFSGFESSVKQGDQLTSRKSELEGLSLRAMISRHGQVLEVRPQTSVSAEMKEELQPLVENLFANLADHPVEPGDTWTHEEKVLNKEDAKAEPRIDGKTEFTLDEVTKKKDKKVAKILGKGTAKVHLQTGMGEVIGDAKGDSEVLVAVDNGYIVHRKSTSEFKGTMGTMEGSRVEYFELELQP